MKIICLNVHLSCNGFKMGKVVAKFCKLVCNDIIQKHIEDALAEEILESKILLTDYNKELDKTVSTRKEEEAS